MTDADQFEAFVRRYQDMVFATAVHLLGNRTDAEDAAQTVFLRAFQRFEEIGPSPAAAGWLRTVTRNVCLNHLARYRSRWRLFSEVEPARGDGLEHPIDRGAVEAASPPAVLERAERDERLEQALLRLPDHQRVPLVLFHFDEASYQEIAVTLGISVGKVKTDIHRAREALKRILTDELL